MRCTATQPEHQTPPLDRNHYTSIQPEARISQQAISPYIPILMAIETQLRVFNLYIPIQVVIPILSLDLMQDIQTLRDFKIVFLVFMQVIQIWMEMIIHSLES